MKPALVMASASSKNPWEQFHHEWALHIHVTMAIARFAITGLW